MPLSLPLLPRARRVFAISVLLGSMFAGAFAQTPAERILTEALIVALPRTDYEVVGAIDPVVQLLVSGKWKTPSAGDALVSRGDTVFRWESVVADSAGWFQHPALKGGYVLFTVRMEKDSTLVLRGMGHSTAWVNGAPRAGNPYGTSESTASWEPDFRYSLLPVELRKGENTILFSCSRDVCKAVLSAPRNAVFFNMRDVTVPDFVGGERLDTRAAVVVVNSTHAPLRGWSILVVPPGELPYPGYQNASVLPVIQSITVRKVGFRVSSPSPAVLGPHSLRLELLDDKKRVVDTATLVLRVVGKSSPRREIFVSEIDGSTQYYAVLPQITDSVEQVLLERPALLFTLHGAGVEAIGQASAYAPKRWATLVAPTNRRPYGYNWEDWGRLDALEVLAIAKRKFEVDHSRVYLTGHSMGGHGAWHLSTLYPDLWAAAGPSAGWVSFWSYRIRGNVRMNTPAAAAVFRGTHGSDTYRLSENLKPVGVYILHGSEDDNVLAKESRSMAERLKGFHRDFIYHEQLGQNHWWDLSDEPGADCVDWAPMMDFFNHHRRPGPDQVRMVEFSTPHPGISSACSWLRIETQKTPAAISNVSLRFDPGRQRFSGTTTNVERLSLDLAVLAVRDSVVLAIDDSLATSVPVMPRQDRLWLEKTNGRWAVIQSPPASDKNPGRSGPFKDVFRNRVTLVYGTKGSAEENRWAFDQARYDAERFWYQGNGSVHVLADVEEQKRSSASLTMDTDRRGNVVLYGNAETNAMWKTLLGGSPVQVRRGAVSIGERTVKGTGLFCLFIRPHPLIGTACVAAVSGTDIEGMRAASPLGYLSPGLPFPDLLVGYSDLYTRGEDALVAAGYFGTNWSVETGDIAWNPALPKSR